MIGEWVSLFESFFQKGGVVLVLIFFISVALWTLIVERLYFYRHIYSRLVIDWQTQWQEMMGEMGQHVNPVSVDRGGLAPAPIDPLVAYSLQSIRRNIVSNGNLQLRKHVSTIKTLIAICPLVGLLGTVTGMIEVFDVIAGSGGNDARAVAAGVSMATIPTMAGMVVAISGFYFANRFQQTVKVETAKLLDLLE